MKTQLGRILGLMLVAVLSACGGGGDSAPCADTGRKKSAKKSLFRHVSRRLRW